MLGEVVMNMIKSIKNMTKTEKIIWITSLAVIIVSSFLSTEIDVLTVVVSLVGATALIFVGKGDAVGQLLTILFAVLYAIISFGFHYYGEMITYLGMTAPSALWAMIVWLKNPYSERQVKVGKMTARKWVFLVATAIVITLLMGKVLEYFHTANLFFSTISVTTSYLASMLTILRSPFYAVAYAANDVILIILWVLATVENTSYFPMVVCFVIFLINNLYGFYNWRRMRVRQGQVSV